jgi:hypothetical protein
MKKAASLSLKANIPHFSPAGMHFQHIWDVIHTKEKYAYHGRR